MMGFIIVSAPRSGSAWVSNWLTTEHSLCLHDPLLRWSFQRLDALAAELSENSKLVTTTSVRQVGIADTSVALLPALHAHPAKKVVIHRDFYQINRSLREANLPQIDGPQWAEALRAVDGLHINFEVLFSHPNVVHRYLFDRNCDSARHQILCDLNVQCEFEHVRPNPEAVKGYLDAIRGAAE